MSERTGGSVPAQRNAGEKVWAYPGRWVFDLKLLQDGRSVIRDRDVADAVDQHLGERSAHTRRKKKGKRACQLLCRKRARPKRPRSSSFATSWGTARNGSVRPRDLSRSKRPSMLRKRPPTSRAGVLPITIGSLGTRTLSRPTGPSEDLTMFATADTAVMFWVRTSWPYSLVPKTSRFPPLSICFIAILAQALAPWVPTVAAAPAFDF